MGQTARRTGPALRLLKSKIRLGQMTTLDNSYRSEYTFSEVCW
jgi:hypothetical protein